MRAASGRKNTVLLSLAIPGFLLAMAAILAGDGMSPVDFQISKGPYLQRPEPTSMVIGFELTNPGTGEVEVRKAGDPASQPLIIKSLATGKLHHVKITGLLPDTRYVYRVRASGAVGGVSVSRETAEFAFRTAPLEERDFSFAATGDNRTQDAIFTALCQTLAREKRPEPEIVVHTGDLVADGREYEQWQKQFFTPAGAWLPGKAFFPVLGNHERDAHFYYDFFDLPGNESYYSFEYAGALFLMINSCKPFGEGSEQYQWIAKTLAGELGKKHSWVFAAFHHPPYSSGPHNRLGDDGRVKEQPARDAQDALVPLFEKFGVSAVFNGHDHIYERSRRNSIYYIVAGGGGAPLYKRSETAREQNPYSEFFNPVYSYVLVSVFKNRLLFQAIDIDGNIFDAFTLLKNVE